MNLARRCGDMTHTDYDSCTSTVDPVYVRIRRVEKVGAGPARAYKFVDLGEVKTSQANNK